MSENSLTYDYCEVNITPNSGIIFVSNEINTNIKNIRQKLCDDYDNKRHSENPNTIFKYTAICYNICYMILFFIGSLIY